MKWFRGLVARWRKQFKVAIYDPISFDELWGFTSSKVRIVSTLLLFMLLVGILTVLVVVKTPLKAYFFSENDHPDKVQLVESMVALDSLRNKVSAQDRYIKSMRNILLGKVEVSQEDTINQTPQIDPSTIDPTLSEAEMKISEKVKDDQRTNKGKTTRLVSFIAPVKGVISQGYEPRKHDAIDVVTTKDRSILACLTGTVIYAGYSPKDGNILILEHANNFVSVYKHAKTRLKKTGDKVSTGDPIAIVGNTGENSTGPHLHFELWKNQQAVDPTQYISFD